MYTKGRTTDEELENWAKKLHVPLNFIGFKDELPKMPKAGGYIINLASSHDGSGGTHWVGAYLAPNKLAFIFDSYGAPPLDEIMDLAKQWTRNLKHIFINPYDIQDIDGNFCGQYVLNFLAHIMRDPSRDNFIKFLKQFKLFRVQKNKDTNI